MTAIELEKSAFKKGGLKSVFHAIQWCEKQQLKIKSQNEVNTNTPRQITNGGKLKMLNDTLVKLREMQKQIEKYLTNKD